MVYFNKAKKDKKVVDFKHIKILLTGSSAAGKSSFCRLLLRLKFLPEHNSTDVMENRQAFSLNEDKKKAIKVQNYSVIKNTEKGDVIWYELDPKQQIRYFKSLLKSKKFYDQPCPHENQDTKNNSNYNPKDVSYNINDDKDHKIDNKESHAIPKINIEKKIFEADSIPDTFVIETVKLITIVDTGGQPEYIHLLPAINSYPTITFLIHNLTKALDNPVKVCYKKEGYEAPVQFLNYSNLDMIHLLMCFVSDSSEKSPPELPLPLSKYSYVGFVGTHYDKVKNNPAVLDAVNKQLSCATKQLKSNCVLNTKIYEVDNTTAGDADKEDENVKKIRDKIEDIANHQIKSSTLPITWMILQLEIQELRTTYQKRYLTYEEYLILAEKNVSLFDEKEVKSSLTYFHYIGTLLYFQNPKLCDYVIIDLQWLYTNLAKVMHLSLKVSFYDGILEEKFSSHRLLAKHDNCKIQLNNINNQELEYLFNLLIHLKVIATIKIDSIEFYYIPCVLSNLKKCNNQHKHLLSEPLLVQFTSGFIPRGFFCCLVVNLLTAPPKKWEHQLDKTEQNYSDLIIFRLPDCTYLYIHDEIFYLKIEVRHQRRNFVPSYHSEIILELCKYLSLV